MITAWAIGALLASPALAAGPEQRALDYLAREVPRWSRENHCFSCHNNGDGARALYVAARQRRYQIPADALSDTTRWLLTPAKWDDNRGNPAFSDKKLARIQFAATLAEACDSGLAKDRDALAAAAASLVPSQEADGSWRIDTGSAAGSPAAWGAMLATYMARTTLEKAGAARFADAIRKANAWLEASRPENILDAAAKLLACGDADSRDRILHAQNSDGGWGPRLHAPSEPFDTAVVLLALRQAKSGDAAIGRGRAYLIAAQQPAGGWPETTRPPGGPSYAQHISTSGWATLALLLTDSER